MPEDREKKRARQRRFAVSEKGRAARRLTNARRVWLGQTYGGYLAKIELPHQEDEDGKTD